MTATTTTSGLIQAGTTKLYHEVRGSGPALLITGGTGDAGEWANLAPTLAEECTVVTYDRRGISRSPRPDRWTATSMAEAADDAAALLRAWTSRRRWWSATAAAPRWPAAWWRAIPRSCGTPCSSRRCWRWCRRASRWWPACGP